MLELYSNDFPWPQSVKYFLSLVFLTELQLKVVGRLIHWKRPLLRRHIAGVLKAVTLNSKILVSRDSDE